MLPADALSLALAAQLRCAHADAERHALHAAALAGSDDPETAYQGWKVAGWSRIERGEDRRAVRYFRRALAVVESSGVLEAHRGPIFHNLFVAYGMAGVPVTAAHYRRAAARTYPEAHPRRPIFDADAAWFMLAGGDHGGAAAALAPLADRVVDPVLRLRVHGNLAVALAGAGRAADARIAVRSVAELLEGPAGCDSWPWVALGWARALLGDVGGAQTAASRGRKLAAVNGEEYARRQAARLLAELS